MSIIIIESPNKVKKLQSLTGMRVFATRGHFKDLDSPGLGVDIENNYSPKFRLQFGKFEMLKQLKAAAKGQEVFIATDPDREGFAIGKMIYDELRSVTRNLKRLEIHEITASGVKSAFSSVVPFEKSNLRTYDAFLGRRITDRMVGFILSPLANNSLKVEDTEKLRDQGYSVGRVQSAAVRLLVENDRAIRNFVPKKFWKLSAELHLSGKNFQVSHTHGSFYDFKKAEQILRKIKSTPEMEVDSVTISEKTQHPRAPFTTVDFQVAASAQLKISPSRAMKLAQDLFEHGLITYHRTDSCRIAPEFVSSIRKVISSSFGQEYLPAKPNFFRSRNSQADAHEGIRPTSAHVLADCPKKIFYEKLSKDHLRIYELIYKRAVASQMSDSVSTVRACVFSCSGEKFTASSRTSKFDGFLKLWQDSSEERKLALEEDDQYQNLPYLTKGQRLKKNSETCSESQTEPPGRYTEAGLVKKLESLGIGRPSTYASISGTIKKRDYATLSNGAYVPTSAGIKLTEFLESGHPWVVDYNMTKEMEEALDSIESGSGSTWVDFVRDVHSRMAFADPSKRGTLPPTSAKLAKAKVLADEAGVSLPENLNSKGVNKFLADYRVPTKPSESQLLLANRLALESKKKIPEEALGDSKLLSNFIDMANRKLVKKKQREFDSRPLTDSQLGVITRFAPEETKNKVLAGDTKLGREFLSSYFEKRPSPKSSKR